MFRMITALCLMMPAAGCVIGPRTSGDALCDGTRAARAEHAAALADSADDRAVVSGARLIRLLDAGCAG
ncbi:hypothetical protein HOY34_11000 [Xinfangfangia sp. D13-10-4-6]|uniref:hypothetical protein n=1 Tax=Pseudogemmobacter hezensis TaxID=2737662 RepID=UPI0015539524|nr:hypothetical protein [Pseudogemmobacter hezensis]NPD15729.1 hypothetical protein [Pseudogemmobacter hezensis]